MPRFRQKQVTVEAIQYTGDNWEELQQFVGDGVASRNSLRNQAWMVLRRGHIYFDEGDWIVRDPKGGLHLIGDDAFQQMYEPDPITKVKG